MSIILSPDQQAALDEISIWLSSASPYLTLGGYAGTGKSTILTQLCRNFPQLRVAMISLTGKAVGVLKKKRDPHRPVLYSTIHSLIYLPILGDNDEIIGWEMRPKEGSKADSGTGPVVPRLDLIINDEASMTSDEIFRDLLSYNIPILFVGDHGQLPPINSDFNLMENPALRLEQIHRQAADNPIIKIATQAREQGWLERRAYSPTVQVLSQTSILYSDIYSQLLQGDSDSLIICATNNQRVNLNKKVLAELNQTTLFAGARLICLRNDRNTGLYNGQHCFLEEIHNIEQDYAEVTLIPDGFEGQKIKLKISTDCFHNPKPEPKYRKFPMFDFGYAITCHKAQGSQAKRVYVMGSGFGDKDMKKRWLYTAVTRAEEELFVIQK